MLLGEPGDRGGRIAACHQRVRSDSALLKDRLGLLTVLFASRETFAPFLDGQGEARSAVVERGDARDEHLRPERLCEGRGPVERTSGWLRVVVGDEDRLH